MESSKGSKIRSFMVPWGIVSITALFIGIILIVVLIAKRGGRYRVIKVEDFNGSVNIERDGSDIDVFSGLQLVSEDIVSTGDNSWLGMLIDSDKHIGADANTTFTITASGSDKKGSVTIDLISGSALFTIEQKLNEDSTFEVTTPNATLSVRGTTFSVSYNPATNTTSTTVSEGTVWAEYGDGQIVELHAGDGGLITDDEFTDREKPIFIVSRIYSMSADPSEGPDSIRFAYTIRGGENKSVWSVSDEEAIEGDETLAKTAADISNGYLAAHEDEIADYINSYRSGRIDQPVSDIPGGDSASGWYLDTFNYGSEDEIDVTGWFPEVIPVEFEDGSGSFRISKAVMWTQVFDENISDGVIKDAYIKELGVGFYGSREE
ncbi:MAG: FecR domain-containing protein [Lachnospiraceae bacterium]|nr:FecR domain-containing protein [Lachnospiraceae bacterium]